MVSSKCAKLFAWVRKKSRSRMKATIIGIFFFKTATTHARARAKNPHRCFSYNNNKTLLWSKCTGYKGITKGLTKHQVFTPLLHSFSLPEQEKKSLLRITLLNKYITLNTYQRISAGANEDNKKWSHEKDTRCTK